MCRYFIVSSSSSDNQSAVPLAAVYCRQQHVLLLLPLQLVLLQLKMTTTTVPLGRLSICIY